MLAKWPSWTVQTVHAVCFHIKPIGLSLSVLISGVLPFHSMTCLMMFPSCNPHRNVIKHFLSNELYRQCSFLITN